jgi:hypothetical protein
MRTPPYALVTHYVSADKSTIFHPNANAAMSHKNGTESIGIDHEVCVCPLNLRPLHLVGAVNGKNGLSRIGCSFCCSNMCGVASGLACNEAATQAKHREINSQRLRISPSSHLPLTWSLLHLPTLLVVLKASAATEEDEVIEQLRGLQYDEGHEASAMAERKLTQCVTRRGTPAKDGTRCELGKCKINERCVGGKCYGDPKCPYDPQCQVPRACRKATGNCYNVFPGRALADEASRQLTNPNEPPYNLPDGTPCDDWNADTYNDRCQNGVCKGDPPIQCTDPFICGGPIQRCVPGCLCTVTTEGLNFCVDDSSCDLASCTISTDCPSGTECVPNTCCGAPVCALPCPGGRGRALEDGADGECIATLSHSCDP